MLRVFWFTRVLCRRNSIYDRGSIVYFQTTANGNIWFCGNDYLFNIHTLTRRLRCFSAVFRSSAWDYLWSATFNSNNPMIQQMETRRKTSKPEFFCSNTLIKENLNFVKIFNFDHVYFESDFCRA